MYYSNLKVETDKATGTTRTKKPKSLKIKKKSTPVTLDFAKYKLTSEDMNGRQCTVPNFDEASAGKLKFYRDDKLKADEPTQFVLRIQLPRLKIADRLKVSIEMSSQFVCLSAVGYRRLEIFLPLPVKKDVTAAFTDVVMLLC